MLLPWVVPRHPPDRDSTSDGQEKEFSFPTTASHPGRGLLGEEEVVGCVWCRGTTTMNVITLINQMCMYSWNSPFVPVYTSAAQWLKKTSLTNNLSIRSKLKFTPTLIKWYYYTPNKYVHNKSCLIYAWNIIPDYIYIYHLMMPSHITNKWHTTSNKMLPPKLDPCLTAINWMLDEPVHTLVLHSILRTYIVYRCRVWPQKCRQICQNYGNEWQCKASLHIYFSRGDLLILFY